MNINIKCKIILTEEGAKYLNNFHMSKIIESKYIFDTLGASSVEMQKIFPINYKSGDILELPMWEIIGKFGRYFEIYTDAAFLNNEIEFLE